MVIADNFALAEDIAPAVLVLSRPDDFSDVVLASAVLAPVRAALPKTKIFLLIREEFAGLFREHHALDGLILLAPDETLRSLAKNSKPCTQTRSRTSRFRILSPMPQSLRKCATLPRSRAMRGARAA